MNYDAIFQKARSLAAQRASQGEPATSEDTVCVISSQSGRMYTGVSHVEKVGGTRHNVHAEAEAIRSMQGGGEAVIHALLLVSVSTGMPILPCEHCLRSVLTLHADNIQSEILMPDRAVPIRELVKDADKFIRRDTPQEPETVPTGAGVLMDHVNSLLNAAEEIDDDEEAEEAPKKGFFGGLFRRKK